MDQGESEGVEMTLTMPTIHLNGTARGDLLADYCTARSCVFSAYDALHLCPPNGRDYYVHQGAFQAAVNEHEDRIGRLKTIYDELSAIIDHIDTSDGPNR